MTTGEAVVLDVDGLRMRYGTTDVLHDVTFQAHHGEVLVLLVPNGAGKTTTIEILEGFRTRSAGRVEVLGTDRPAPDGTAGVGLTRGRAPREGPAAGRVTCRDP